MEDQQPDNIEERIIKALDMRVFRVISEVAGRENIPAFVVGGYVRDIMLQRPSGDIDVVVVGEGIPFARRIAGEFGREANLSVFRNFGTANLKYGDYEIEFVGARKESYRRHSRKPIVEEGSLDDDLRRRDFTINALAVELDGNNCGKLIDRFNGVEDLERGIIRTPLEPEQTFSDDPLRMMRAIRFATQLHFHLHGETLRAIELNRERIGIVSQERITDELNKIMMSPEPSVGFRLLNNTGLLELIFPELAEMKGVETIEDNSHKDNFFHTIQVVDNVAESSDNLWLRWAALLHDIGKPATKRYDEEHGWTFHGHEVVGAQMVPHIFRRLKLPLNEKMKYVRKLVRLHLRPIALTSEEVTDSAIRRLIVDAGNDIEDLIRLCKADITSKNQVKRKLYSKRFSRVREKVRDVDERDRLRNWKNPISGEEIMETFNIPPSRLIGDIKEEIKEAIMNGEIPNEHDKAFQFMIRAGRERGLSTE